MPRILCDSCHGLGCWTCAGEGFTGKDDPPVVKAVYTDTYTQISVASPQQTQKYVPKGGVSAGGGIRGSGGPSVGGGTSSPGGAVIPTGVSQAQAALQNMACASCKSRLGWIHKYSHPLPHGGGTEHTFACGVCGYDMFFRVPPPVPLVAP